MQQDIITSSLIIIKINTQAKKIILKAECVLIYPHNAFIINEHLFLLLHTLCCAFFLFTLLLTSPSPAGLEAVEVGVGQQPVPRPVRHVLTLYLHINSSIDYVCVKRREKGSREVRKTPNGIHQKQQPPMPFRKKEENAACTPACTHTHTHIPFKCQGGTHHTLGILTHL